MVKAMINISEEANWILNIVKAKYKLKDKSEAINFVVDEYEEKCLKVKPEYMKKLSKISKGKHYSRKEFDRAMKK